MITLGQFVTRALPVPFVEHGRGYDGWDCWGMLLVAYRDVYGIELPSFVANYESTRDREHLHQLMSTNMERWARVNDPRPGDGALFRIAGRPVHVGLLVDDRRVLHSEERVGTFVERLDSPMWAKRLEGVYRYAR